jgi:hypothetical protein
MSTVVSKPAPYIFIGVIAGLLLGGWWGQVTTKSSIKHENRELISNCLQYDLEYFQNVKDPKFFEETATHQKFWESALHRKFTARDWLRFQTWRETAENDGLDMHQCQDFINLAERVMDCLSRKQCNKQLDGTQTPEVITQLRKSARKAISELHTSKAHDSSVHKTP